jgi:hypothetical protein
MILTISRTSALRAACCLGLNARDDGNIIGIAIYTCAISQLSGISLRDTWTDEISSSHNLQFHNAETLPGIGVDRTIVP